MDKKEILKFIFRNHSSFIKYMNELSEEQYSFSHSEKWSAAQQLEHIVLCVKPIVHVFSMEKPAIKIKFGSTDKPSRSYEALLLHYIKKLNEGGKAPERFVPAENSLFDKSTLCAELNELTKQLCSKIETFTEEELDTLCIPHPLLGSLTLREMLFNVIYHAKHHHEETIRYLKMYSK